MNEVFKRLFVRCVACCVLTAAAPAFAQLEGEPTESLAARERIALERREIETAFAVGQKQCYQRFAVNDCLRERRATRRGALAQLRQQEIALNDAERQRKAAKQQQKIAEREQERARNETAAQTRQAATPAERTASPKPLAPARPAEARRSTNPPIAPRQKTDPVAAERRRAEDARTRAERASEAETNAARYEEKRKEAAEHKAKVLHDNAAKGKTAAPLPAMPPFVVLPPAATPLPAPDPVR
ncbi:MAG: hypothetical protein ABI589_03805 [Burkholderiales bacterium]